METMIREIGERVIAALEAAEYAELTIGNYRKWIRLLELCSRECGGAYTAGLGAEFAGMTTSPRTGKFSAQRCRDYNRLVAVFDSYLLTGQVDLSVKRRGSTRALPQSQEFSAILAAWSEEIEQRGLAAETRKGYGRMAGDYLLYLEGKGTRSLQLADGASVLGFLESLGGRWAEDSMWSAVINCRPFLQFIQRPDLVDALKMVGAKRHHGIVSLMGDEEEQAAIRACTGGKVSARDAAITLLALVTGLRACDLIALRLNDIDWRTLTIGIIQQKTGNPLTLPLLPVIAGRLAEYVLDERPNSGDGHVFLRSLAPYTRLTEHASIYAVTRRVFKAAGVDRRQVGTRGLRHHAASKLLRAGTPLPTISAVLGHSNPDSTYVYLSTDTEHMRSCVLPLLPQQGVVR